MRDICFVLFWFYFIVLMLIVCLFLLCFVFVLFFLAMSRLISMYCVILVIFMNENTPMCRVFFSINISLLLGSREV